ncbi:hypothetical protein C8J56DRAFT_939107 [Mycena floridula]|nr:hypothetical protein C8J56DRAFT_939107 [Mycena floridula]
MRLFLLISFWFPLALGAITLSAPSSVFVGEPLLVSWTRTGSDLNEFILLSVSDPVEDLVYDMAIPAVYIDTGTQVAGNRNVSMSSTGKHVLAALDPVTRALLGHTGVIQTTRRSDSDANRSMRAVIIGISIAGAFLVLGSLGFFIYWRRRRRRAAAFRREKAWAVLPAWQQEYSVRI